MRAALPPRPSWGPPTRPPPHPLRRSSPVLPSEPRSNNSIANRGIRIEPTSPISVPSDASCASRARGNSPTSPQMSKSASTSSLPTQSVSRTPPARSHLGSHPPVLQRGADEELSPSKGTVQSARVSSSQSAPLSPSCKLAGSLTPSNKCEEEAVCRRVAAMLVDLQRQYVEKLEAIMQNASGKPLIEIDPALRNAVLPVAAPAETTDAASEITCKETSQADNVQHSLASIVRPSSCAQKESESLLGAQVSDSKSSIMTIQPRSVEASLDCPKASPMCTPSVADCSPCNGQHSNHAGIIDLTADCTDDLLSPSSASNAPAANCTSADADTTAGAASDAEIEAKKTKTRPKVLKRNKTSRLKDSIRCQQTIHFEGCAAVRCAESVNDEVWTADWSGRLFIRDRDDIEKLKVELPSPGLIWRLRLVKARVPLMWVGQERAGIPIYNAMTRELLCTLIGGHSGNVTDFAVADGPDGRIDVWSASNDFSIRCWHVEPGRGSGGSVRAGNSGVQIRKGYALYGHTNGVRSIQRIGPTLWSGSDDRSIRLWKTSDGESCEVVHDAHESGVTCLVVAGLGVWSSGLDGRVKEWTFDGETRSCTRELKLDEPVRELLVVGPNVWVCGKSPNISVYSEDMRLVHSLEGHSSFVSSLCLVDRSETRTVWSTSLGDHSLKAWQQGNVVRGEATSFADLLAANKLYEAQHLVLTAKLKTAEAADHSARVELSAATVVFSAQLQDCLARAAAAELARDTSEADRANNVKSQDEAQRDAEAARAQLEVEQIYRKRAEEAGRIAADEAAVSKALADQLQSKFRDATDLVKELRVALTTESCRAADLQDRLTLSEDTATKLAAGTEDLRQSRERAADLLEAERRRRLDGEDSMEELRKQLAHVTQERDEACAREKQMEKRFKEIDHFKLDVIARELKSMDRQIEKMRAETRALQEVAKKMSNIGDQTTCTNSVSSLLDTVTALRGQIRDVIEQCLSETQKRHVGARNKASAAELLEPGSDTRQQGGIRRLQSMVRKATAANAAPPSSARQQEDIRQSNPRSSASPSEPREEESSGQERANIS